MSDKPSKWIPLEANPEVLSSWSSQAGLAKETMTFHDVYGLDPELLAMVPKPVKAVVFLFPITEALEEKRRKEDEAIKAGQVHLDPTVVFIKQTISNACGTIGLLHALINSDVTFVPSSPLSKFIEQVIPLSPIERAKLLEETELFASIHRSAAHSGQSQVPERLDTDLHFSTFVQAPSPHDAGLHLVELDGRREGPIERGISDDLLADVAKYVKEHYFNQPSSFNFSLIALAPPE